MLCWITVEQYWRRLLNQGFEKRQQAAAPKAAAALERKWLHDLRRQRRLRHTNLAVGALEQG
jgi:hypothetical protein